MIPGVNIFSRKASMPSVRGAAGGESGGAMSHSAGVLGGQEPPKNLFRL